MHTAIALGTVTRPAKIRGHAATVGLRIDAWYVDLALIFIAGADRVAQVAKKGIAAWRVVAMNTAWNCAFGRYRGHTKKVIGQGNLT